MLTHKWYLLTLYPHPKITAMRSSPTVRIQPSLRVFARCALAAAIFALSVTPALHAQLSSEGNLTVAEQYLVSAANHERAALGLPALRLDSALSQASALHARQMAEHEDISHQFADEPDLEERGANAGVRFSVIAENVGEAPTSVIIHNLWMESPGHRANLLDPEVNTIGIAVVVRDEQLYAVEDFARTVESLSLNEQESTVAKVLVSAGMPAVDTTADARITCAMPTGYVGSRRPWYIMRYTASTLTDLPTQLKARLTSGKYHQAVIGACADQRKTSFAAYNIAVLLYP